MCEPLDVAIIGAGPAGMQISLLLKTLKINHMIFERNHVAGSFFDTFPKHRRLISINKKNTGSNNFNFNMRHDWHSLLNAPMFADVTNCSSLYPHADELSKYLKYISKFLPIKFNQSVNIIPEMSIVRTHEKCYEPQYIVIATGYSNTRLSFARGAEMIDTYASMSTDIGEYRNKSVLILGHGNAAYETASFISKTASHIHVIGRTKQRTVWNTHYPGDARTRHGVFDMYFLKSQVVVGEAEGGFVKEHGFVKNSQDKIQPIICTNVECDKYEFMDDANIGYDKVIDCTGWKVNLDMLEGTVDMDKRNKFPLLNWDFSSINYPNLFFAGVAAHSIDYKESSGGFIHGFRYMTKALVNILFEKLTGVRTWVMKSLVKNTSQIIASIEDRINNADSMYQMFGHMGDVLLLYEESVLHIVDVPINSVGGVIEKYKPDRILLVTLEYGENAKTFDPFNHDTIDTERGENSVFLHPVIRLIEFISTPKVISESHIPENIWNDWRIRDSELIDIIDFLVNA